MHPLVDHVLDQAAHAVLIHLPFVVQRLEQRRQHSWQLVDLEHGPQRLKGACQLRSAILTTRSRCSDVKKGGSPAAAFSRTCPGCCVAVRTVLTRGSPATHFRIACAHVFTPSSWSSAFEGNRSRMPFWRGLMTSTPRPIDAASGSSSRSAVRRSGL